MTIPCEKIKLLGLPTHSLSMHQTLDFINSRLEKALFTQHVVVNVAKLVHSQKDQTLKKSVEDCDIINIDGMGVVWGARLLGHDVPERVAGIDLFSELIKLSSEKNYPVFLLGAKQEIVVKVADKLQKQHPNLNLSGFHHGYFWDDEQAIVEKIKASGAKLLFVAITSPKKENFINKWKEQLGVDFVMGVGGTFDVIAGKVSRAPIWMQKSGLEWLYRVIQEPKRMWKRYLFTNGKFAALLLKAKLAQLTVKKSA